MPRAWQLLAGLTGVLVSALAHAIVNGVAASDAVFTARFPWAVALEDPISGGVCTAQLIAPRWVLGAAHCASAGQRLLVGHASRTRARTVGIAQVIRHPRYEPATGEYDVALIRLVEPVAARPVPVATAAESARLLREGRKAVIAGWGRRSSRDDYSDRLVVSDVVLQRLERRASRFGYIDAASGPCGGDSGGPLVMGREDGTEVLLGVASRTGGNLCAAGGGVRIYIDVSRVRDFIVAHVRDLPP